MVPRTTNVMVGSCRNLIYAVIITEAKFSTIYVRRQELFEGDLGAADVNSSIQSHPQRSLP